VCSAVCLIQKSVFVDDNVMFIIIHLFTNIAKCVLDWTPHKERNCVDKELG